MTWHATNPNITLSGTDNGARIAIEIFFDIDQALEMVRVPLVTVLPQEM